MVMEAEAQIDAPAKSKKKLILIAVGVLVLGGAGYMFLGGGGGEAEASVTTTTMPVEGPVLEADQMTINLADDDLRYARIKFAVVLPEGGDTAAVGERFPVLKDAVLQVVSGYAADQLLGPEALDRLREQFTTAAHGVWTEGEVLRVVITEILVQ
jgi:flagellar basal body-associated protein FliL